MFWDRNTEEESTTTETTPALSYTTTTTIQPSKVTTMKTRVKEVGDVNTVSFNTAASFKDTAEFKALVTKLNNTLEFLKIQEEEKRRRVKLSQANRIHNKPAEVEEV